MTGYSSSIKNLGSSHQYEALRPRENTFFIVSNGQTNLPIQNTVKVLFSIIKKIIILCFSKENNLVTEHQDWLQYSNLSHAKKLFLYNIYI